MKLACSSLCRHLDRVCYDQGGLLFYCLRVDRLGFGLPGVEKSAVETNPDAEYSLVSETYEGRRWSEATEEFDPGFRASSYPYLMSSQHPQIAALFADIAQKRSSTP